MDSGAEECLLNSELASQLGLTIELLNQPLVALSLNGLYLAPVTKRTAPVDLVIGGNHREKISFCVIDGSDPPSIFGHPWLQLHNPHLDWQSSEIISWRPTCHQLCLHSALTPAGSSPPAAPETIQLDSVPPQYHDLISVLSKTLALSLPPHRCYDCAIELLPGFTLPSSRCYSLSKPEQQAVETYIRDSVVAGII